MMGKYIYIACETNKDKYKKTDITILVWLNVKIVLSTSLL